MGSPYFVHKQANRIHVIKTASGLARILNTVQNTMGVRSIDNLINLVDDCSPEWVVIRDILLAYRSSFHTNSRQVIFLEARYEWTGWEKFQRVIIIDNCKGTLEAINDELIRHFRLLEDFC
jgi:hypothetical protein